MPSGTAAQKARRIAMTASSMVTRKRSFNWSHTGVLYHRDVPRSPRSTCPSQLAYWAYMGRSRPSVCRNCWSCAGETAPLSPSPPARMVKAGSPGTIQKSVNTSTVATSSVGIKRSTLRMAYSPIHLSQMQDYLYTSWSWLPLPLGEGKEGYCALLLWEWGVGVPPDMLKVFHNLL